MVYTEGGESWRVITPEMTFKFKKKKILVIQKLYLVLFHFMLKTIHFFI